MTDHPTVTDRCAGCRGPRHPHPQTLLIETLPTMAVTTTAADQAADHVRFTFTHTARFAVCDGKTLT